MYALVHNAGYDFKPVVIFKLQGEDHDADNGRHSIQQDAYRQAGSRFLAGQHLQREALER
jgi:hypothetical protein